MRTYDQNFDRPISELTKNYSGTTKLITKIKPKKEVSNVDKFYNWLLNCGNIYLNDNEQITNAFNKII